jgi:hypothetical protein
VSDTVRDAIAEGLAALTPVVTTPAAPFGYGADLSCVSDLTETMDEIDPFSPRALGEALARRLDCPRGGLPDDADYGIDLRDMLNVGLTTAEIRALAAQIRTELLKDDRVDAIRVEVAPAPNGSSLRIALVVTPVDPQIGVFSMTLAATTAGVVIEAMGAP